MAALAMVAVLATAAVVVFASMAVAQTQPSITLNPTSGPPGTTVQVSGSGFSQAPVCELFFESQFVGGCTIDANGLLSGSFLVPSVPEGGYTVSARTSEGGRTIDEARAPFTVTSPPTTTTTTTITTTTTTTVAPTTTTTTTVPGATTTTTTAPGATTTTTDATGATTTTDPTDSTTTTTTGSTAKTSDDDDGDDGEVGSDVDDDGSFALTAASPSAPPGGAVTVAGTGCRPRQVVRLSVDGERVHSLRAEADGSFSVPLTLAGLDPGRHVVEARCGDQVGETPVDIVITTIGSSAAPATAGAVLLFFLLLVMVLSQGRAEAPLPVEPDDDLDDLDA